MHSDISNVSLLNYYYDIFDHILIHAIHQDIHPPSDNHILNKTVNLTYSSWSKDTFMENRFASPLCFKLSDCIQLLL